MYAFCKFSILLFLCSSFFFYSCDGQSNYDVRAKILALTYPTDWRSLLQNQTTQVQLGTAQGFQNQGNSSITQTYYVQKDFTSTFTYGFSEGVKIITTVETQVGIPLLAEATVTVSEGIHFDANQEWSTETTDSYEVDTEIDVPPQVSVQVMSYVNWAHDMKIPFTATMAVSMYNSGESKASRPDFVKSYLMSQAPDLTILDVKGDAVIVQSSGQIVGQMGLSTITIAEHI